MHKAYQTAMLLLAVFMFCGCQKVDVPLLAYSDEGVYLPPPTGPGLVANPKSPIPDVPVPIGFEPLVSKSTCSFDGYAREVNHHYQGQGSQAEAIVFYRQHLWLMGWEFMQRDNEEDATAVLCFEKGRETLTVRIQPKAQSAIITLGIVIEPKRSSQIMVTN